MAAHAEDSSTDTAGQYIDDAALTSKVKAAVALHNNLVIATP